MDGPATDRSTETVSRVINVVSAIVVFGALAWIGTWNYLIFHSLAELFSIIVAAAIFVIVWNVRDTIENGYILFLGIAWLFMAGIDLLHMLAFSGMGVFPQSDSDLPTQLWIAARGLEALSLLIAPVFITRRVGPLLTFGVYLSVSALIVLSIFLWDVFPVCYIEGQGLTPFKINAEYAICLILALAMILLWRSRSAFRRPTLLLLCSSIAVTILSELAFTQYAGVYGDFNLAGHLLKIVAVLLIYKAVVETGFRRPYELLYHSLAESERKFRLVVESNVIGVAFVDPVTGDIVDANDEYLRISGRTRGELKEGRLNWKSITPPESVAREEDLVRQLVSGSPVDTFETEYIHSDGNRVPVIIAGAFLDDKQRVVLIVLDNAARKRAEEELRKAKENAEQMARELARSNKELEQFGYIVSHDLQEPLRTVSGFVSLLRDRYAAALDDKARRYITFAIDGTERMARLIRDLLEYSRVSKDARQTEEIDAGQVFEEAKANCIAAIRESGAKVTAGVLPIVRGDKRQLTQLFQNLIGNAVKFRRPQVPPEVRVEAERQDGYWLFRVQDNGIGIPEEGIQRLFQPFQRLHGRSEYDGTGIGLALCRKIVELHGGRIWIDSRPGEGTSVHFTIKAGSKADDSAQT